MMELYETTDPLVSWLWSAAWFRLALCWVLSVSHEGVLLGRPACGRSRLRCLRCTSRRLCGVRMMLG